MTHYYIARIHIRSAVVGRSRVWRLVCPCCGMEIARHYRFTDAIGHAMRHAAVYHGTDRKALYFNAYG